VKAWAQPTPCINENQTLRCADSELQFHLHADGVNPAVERIFDLIGISDNTLFGGLVPERLRRMRPKKYRTP
jgi:hypothetical protein